MPERGKGKTVEIREKNYGIDALRILSMFMVVILHILNVGGVLNAAGIFSIQYELAVLLNIATFCAVNVYALISGYVWVNAKYRFRNIIELWLQVLFYTVLITAIFWIFSPSSVSLKVLVKSVFPIMFNQYWYFSSYFALFLFIPLLNIIVEKTEKKQLLVFLGIILFFFSCVQTLFHSDAFCTNDGYSALWLMILYLVGGYIRKYEPGKNVKPAWFLIGYLVMICLTWLSKLCIELLTVKVLGRAYGGNYLVRYISPTILMSAIFLVLFFSRLNISAFCKKAISLLAPMSFGVYLIHVHPLVFCDVLTDRFVGYAELPWILEVLAVLGTAAAIYIICSLVDFVRLQLFKLLRVRKNLDSLENRIRMRISK